MFVCYDNTVAKWPIIRSFFSGNISDGDFALNDDEKVNIISFFEKQNICFETAGYWSVKELIKNIYEVIPRQINTGKINKNKHILNIKNSLAVAWFKYSKYDQVPQEYRKEEIIYICNKILHQSVKVLHTLGNKIEDKKHTLFKVNNFLPSLIFFITKTYYGYALYFCHDDKAINKAIDLFNNKVEFFIKDGALIEGDFLIIRKVKKNTELVIYFHSDKPDYKNINREIYTCSLKTLPKAKQSSTAQISDTAYVSSAAEMTDISIYNLEEQEENDENEKMDPVLDAFFASFFETNRFLCIHNHQKIMAISLPNKEEQEIVEILFLENLEKILSDSSKRNKSVYSSALCAIDYLEKTYQLDIKEIIEIKENHLLEKYKTAYSLQEEKVLGKPKKASKNSNKKNKNKGRNRTQDLQLNFRSMAQQKLKQLKKEKQNSFSEYLKVIEVIMDVTNTLKDLQRFPNAIEDNSEVNTNLARENIPCWPGSSDSRTELNQYSFSKSLMDVLLGKIQ